MSLCVCLVIWTGVDASGVDKLAYWTDCLVLAHFIASLKKWICKSPQCQIVCDNLWQMRPAGCDGWVHEYTRPLQSEVCIWMKMYILSNMLLSMLASTGRFTLYSVYTVNSAYSVFHACAFKMVICSGVICICILIYRHYVINMAYTNFRFYRCPFIPWRVGTGKLIQL